MIPGIKYNIFLSSLGLNAGISVDPRDNIQNTLIDPRDQMWNILTDPWDQVWDVLLIDYLSYIAIYQAKW